jgi:prepilin-type N-terminal cleavage/methylation domain-containing protein
LRCLERLRAPRFFTRRILIFLCFGGVGSWGRHAARARGEDGFSLPELLVAAMLTLIVAAATLPLLITAMNQTENQSDRVVALDEARNGMVRMSSEIRGAAALVNVSPQILDIMVWDESTASYHFVTIK